MPTAWARSTALRMILALSARGRGRVDRGIGNQERLRVGRYIFDLDLAQSALGAHGSVVIGHSGAKLVGLQRAFHQQSCGGQADRRSCSSRLCAAVRSSDPQAEAGNVKIAFAGSVGDSERAPTRIGPVHPSRCVGGGNQRCPIARQCDRRPHRDGVAHGGELKSMAGHRASRESSDGNP